MRHLLPAALVLSAFFQPSPNRVRGDEKLKGIACRSVHLHYPASDGSAFYNEVSVEKSAEGTYFMVCGFGGGYFGMQERADGKKVVLFSVWDPGKHNDPNEVADNERVKLLYKDDAVRVGRFGGEGTGGQSFLDYDWDVGETYRFLVNSHLDGEQRNSFAAYFYLPEKKEWKHLATFSTLAGVKGVRGYYSFVEDFRRNRVSTTKVRKAFFGNGWVQTKEGQWVALTRAQFTADKNPAVNINAGVVGDRFFLATGGDIENTATKLREFANRPPTGIALPSLK